jgi:hypothetical protein
MEPQAAHSETTRKTVENQKSKKKKPIQTSMSRWVLYLTQNLCCLSTRPKSMHRDSRSIKIQLYSLEYRLADQEQPFCACYTANMKKILVLIAACILIAGVLLISRNKAMPQEDTAVPLPVAVQSVELCFYHETETDRGLYDVSWARLVLSGGEVVGEFRSIPAEKDSKIGPFEGVVGDVDPFAMARTADVWWRAEGEGIQNTEQLRIIFGEGTAQAGFGEMIDRGDGTYIYKDPSSLFYGTSMSDVACSDIDDRVVVAEYVRENIATLAPSEPILGGSWYAAAIHIDPAIREGVMTYEDGHMQQSAIFTYERTDDQVTISNIEKID